MQANKGEWLRTVSVTLTGSARSPNLPHMAKRSSDANPEPIGTRSTVENTQNLNREFSKAQRFAKKWSVLFSLVFSITALIFSVLSFWNARTQIANTRKTSHVDVSPNLSCAIAFPLTFTGTNRPAASANPTVKILNRGPIKVVSLSVIHEIFTFSSNGALQTWIGERDPNHEFLFFEKELLPSKLVEASLVGSSIPAVYVFHLSYFREEDMQQFTRNEFFFVQNGQVTEHKEFRNHLLYRKIMHQIFTFVNTNSVLSTQKLLN